MPAFKAPVDAACHCVDSWNQRIKVDIGHAPAILGLLGEDNLMKACPGQPEVPQLVFASAKCACDVAGPFDASSKCERLHMHACMTAAVSDLQSSLVTCGSRRKS